MTVAIYVMRHRDPGANFCVARTTKRDTYRYTGRTKSRFEMHYTHPQCTRKPITQTEFCWQHTLEPRGG